MARHAGELTYSQLKEKAKDLGLRHVGVKKAVLAEMVEQACADTTSRTDTAECLGKAAGSVVATSWTAVSAPVKWLGNVWRYAGRGIGRGARIAGLKTSGCRARRGVRAAHARIGSEVCRLSEEGHREINTGKGRLGTLIREARSREKALEEIDARVQVVRGGAPQAG